MLTAQHRGLSDNSLFRELCKLMSIHRPLGQPTYDYDPALEVPYEVFALFSGHIQPNVAHEKILGMLEATALDPQKKLILTALVETIFDNAERVSSLTIIPTGVALLKSLLRLPDVSVYIYTNAPTQWIEQYKTLFPEIFAGIPTNHILASGKTGFIKPSTAAFQAICTEAACEMRCCMPKTVFAHVCRKVRK